ncbi:hypothetical protein AS188_15935 (plasmid) [Kocuria flava]|uniref:Antitoxin Xre/MbcA/ParS-like toxin-binding domain-containing protein n=1 Tax=Kocuria flava TaxID=446860 RepID=A0A0U2XTB6_9MICC|nr:hypothetical protein [Kocuria flava]ALU41378.1 hypothetical protein AS188_15935 [Kocuria flava]GEO93442.1 hypothetical protein KFL01_27480 [Kocuria flava]
MSTAPMAPRANLQAHRDSHRWPLPQVVEGLREILGARLVAYLGGVKETRAVRQWIEGTREPGSEAVKQRLRDAYYIAALLAEREAPGVVQAWFAGMNPQLGDRAPARLLREGDPEQTVAEVTAAARAFVATAG